jgi:hypothetical protein
MLADEEIHRVIDAGELVIEPFSEESLQPASYDFRVGSGAFASSTKEKVDISEKGLIVIEPGDFAVVETRERVEFSTRVAALLGLRSEYARDPEGIPPFLREEPVWNIEEEELPDYLACRDDPEREGHVLIEPGYSMDIGDFQDAVAETRDSWRECA